ncbi:hypothetical protein AOLI_G00003130 [Acnodon oligacanthus]
MYNYANPTYVESHTAAKCPEQLLVGRRLQTTVPTLPALLNPALLDAKTIARKENERRILDTKHFNMHHRARDLSKLLSGEEVWVIEAKASGSVVACNFTPRSYLVNTPQCTVRHNCCHLIPLQTAVEDSDSPTHA